ncbi:hypothetical protein G0U57_020176 [Chelydra serpentina]|uniref:Uncharacterized protein n=1 Tax=Chelydra serpentina TaxID=8475 RepID=A0A8T1S3H8_CHESE|nr:hypothetical protein G0U57_020176 [Chelydra serpentina]
MEFPPLFSLSGALPALSIITPKNPARAITSQTALLPFSLQSLNSAWEFIYIKWEFITGTGNLPILVYILDNCTGTAHNWWETTCQLTKEVAKEYQQRADICQNATLVIRGVQAEDAGMYLVTVRTLDVWANATVNLMVTEVAGKFAWKSLSPISTIRLFFACLVLCILALTVGEVSDCCCHLSIPSKTCRKRSEETYDGGESVGCCNE